MTTDDIARHYSRGDLLSRLNAALIGDGANPEQPTIEALAPYDQFHGRGMEATIEMAAMLPARPSDHILDIGSGIGGPARYVASRFGCRVTGIDLTAEFCDVARHLTGLMRLDDRVRFERGDALHMPFKDGSFDGAYSMNVSMNIADKLAFYREIHRVSRRARGCCFPKLRRATTVSLTTPPRGRAARRRAFSRRQSKPAAV